MLESDDYEIDEEETDNESDETYEEYIYIFDITNDKDTIVKIIKTDITNDIFLGNISSSLIIPGNRKLKLSKKKSMIEKHE